MKPTFSILALAAALAAPSAGLAQEVAGRVLVAVGDVLIERAAARIPAHPGTEIRTGDTFLLGKQSNAQLRLTDESIIALRPETTFKLTEYVFQGRNETEQRAFFDLVRGGMRTVTGIIGRLRRDNYGVTTSTATIGIRGTHFNAVECANSCFNRDGSLAPNGTYGSVTDGRIGVINRTGEIQFGADQIFYVASATTRPEQLIAPPPFLRDTLEGRTRAPSKPTAPDPQRAREQPTTATGGESAPAVALTGANAGTGDISTASAITRTTFPTVLTINVYQATTSTPDPAITLLQPTTSGTLFYRLEGTALGIPVLTCGSPPCSTIVSGDITLGVNFTLGRAAVSVNFKTNDGDIFNVGTPFGTSNPGIPITVSGGQVTFSGTFNRVDFPQNQGAFRCSSCGPNDTLGFLDSISVSGTISGSQATLLLSGTDAGGGGSFAVTLPQATPPNNLAAAATTPTFGGGASSRSAAYWAVSVDGSGRLLDIGPTVGGIKGNVGSASNVIVGSAPTAGNLVWGHWAGAGAQITDFNYVTFATGAGSSVPWITGTATNTLPPSLGTLSYTPVGSFVNGGTGIFNGGSLTADFVNRIVNLSLNATNPGAGNTFQMNGTSSFSSVSGRFSAGFNSVSCTGPCVGGTPGGNFGGFFAGTNAEGAGVAFNAGFALGTGVNGVAAFKR